MPESRAAGRGGAGNTGPGSTAADGTAGAGPAGAVLRGRVHAIETFGTVDGPGVRYVVFLQGCPLSCAYCHNRDSWERSGGTLTDIKEIGSELRSLAPFYRDGGVTVTGGEPLVQPAFCRGIFDLAHALGLNTALDTSGHAILSPLVHSVLDACDLVLLDLKHGTDEGYRRLVGAPLAPVLRFAEELRRRGLPTWIRHVLVPGYTDDVEDVKALAGHLLPLDNVERIDLLPYHELGRHKWEARGTQYKLGDVRTPSKKDLKRVADLLTESGIPGKKIMSY